MTSSNFHAFGRPMLLDIKSDMRGWGLSHYQLRFNKSPSVLHVVFVAEPQFPFTF